MNGATRVLRVDVGGTRFCTTEATLLRSSFFAAALSHVEREEEGEESSILFVDRDPTHFRWVLNAMRGSGAVPRDRQTYVEVAEEADFYGVRIGPYREEWDVAHSLLRIGDRFR